VGAFAEHNDDGSLTLKIEHWLHEPNNKNTRTPFLTLNFKPSASGKGLLTLDNAKLQNKALDVSNPRVVSNIESMYTELAQDLRNERVPPNLMAAAAEYKFKTSAMPGIFKTGAAKNAYKNADGRPQRSLDVPTDYVDSLLGMDQEDTKSTGTALVRRSIIRDPEEKSAQVKQELTFKRGATKRDRKTYISATITSSQGHENIDDDEKATLFDLVLRPKSNVAVSADKAITSIKSFKICGAALDKKEHKDLVRGLNFVRDFTVPTLAGVPTDPQEIISYTHLQEELSPIPEMKKDEDVQVFIRAVGGNPTDIHIKNEEEGIGANAWHYHIREKNEKGDTKATNFGIDAGIKPLDTDKTGYDGFFTYLGDFFPHRTNDKHKPKFPTDDWLITERHIDHINGLAFAIMSGYKVNKVHLSATSQSELVSLLKSNGVTPEWYPEFHIIEPNEVFKIGNVEIEAIETPHSTKSYAYLLKFPNGTKHMHFGDSKLSPVVTHGKASEEELLEQFKKAGPVDSALIDCTRINQVDQAKPEDDVALEILEDVRSQADKNIVSTQIGSNFPRLLGKLAVAGQTGHDMVLFGQAIHRARKQLNIKCFEDDTREKFLGLMEKLGYDEKAIEKVRHAENTINGIAKALDVDLINYSANGKKANAMLNGETTKPHWMIFTGSHFEPKSWMHRFVYRTEPALKNIQHDNYWVLGSQYAIPGNEKPYNYGYADLERRGFNVIHRHTSGHDGQAAWRKILDNIKPKYGITGHGDQVQRKAGVDFLKEVGVVPVNPTEQDFIQVTPGKLDITAQHPSIRVYYRYQRPKDQYWGSVEDIDFFASKSQPALRNEAGQLIRKAHDFMAHPTNQFNAKRKSASLLVAGAADVEDIMMNLAEANLLPKEHRVKMSLPDWKVTNGVMNEFMYDVETTGLGHYARTHQFAAIRRDNEGKLLENINIRSKLDKHILFDLEGMIATGTMPQDLYKKGVSQREFAMEMYDSFEKMQFTDTEERITKKMYIDQSKPAVDPRIRVKAQSKQDAASPPSEDELRKRDRRIHPYMRKSIKPIFNKKAAAPDAILKGTFVKGLVGGYNNTGFDDPRIRMECFAAGYANFFPTNRSMRRYDTRNIARAFYYFRPDRFKVQTKAETNPDSPENIRDMLDFTVKGLAIANGLKYSEDAAHDADYDVNLQFRLLDHMRSLDPELYTQMIMNTDKPQIKGFLRGSKNGHVYQRPLVSYVDNRALNAQRHVGFMVGTSNIPQLCNKAVLFNAEDFDPKDFEDMSSSDISEIMSSPDHHLFKAFNIIDISKNPIVLESDRSFRLGTRTPQEQIKERKRYMERNPILAEKIIKALENARFIPDGQPHHTVEKRFINMAAFRLSPNDKKLADLYEPVRDEFKDEAYAKSLNKERAIALDYIEMDELRERYVLQLFNDPNGREFLHDDDQRYARAITRAYFCGELEVTNPFQSPVSI
jgi:mRNA degradation ribonuclease J1/J2/exonuclease I